MPKLNALMVPQPLDMDAAREHAQSLISMGAEKKDAARVAVAQQLARRNPEDRAAYHRVRQQITADTARRRAAGEDL